MTNVALSLQWCVPRELGGGAHIGMGEKTAWTEKNDKILKWETGRARYKMKTAMEGITTDNSVKNYICIK